MRRFLIRNTPRFYGLPLDLCEKRIVEIFVNAPQFDETCHVFTGKASQSLEKRHNPWKSVTILGKASQSLEKRHNPWKSVTILGKASQSLEKRHNPWKSATILGKVPQSFGCGALQDDALSGIASKCGAHRGISVAHSTPR